MDSAEVQQVLSGFVESVIERLIDCGAGSTRLAEEWAAVQEADADEAAYCRAAASLGLDPYSEAAKFETEILRAASQLDPDILGEFLNSVNPEKMAEDLDWISAVSREIARMPSPPEPVIARLRTDVLHGLAQIEDSPPWEVGYSGARLLRRSIGLRATDPFDLSGYVTKKVVPAPDRSLHALGGGRIDAAPSVVLGRQQLENSERFTLARALWHFLRRPQEWFLITPAHTARQKAERAFAAELLAPAEGVAQLIGDNPDDIGVDELELAERHFRVSSLIIQHQIDNQLTYA